MTVCASCKKNEAEGFYSPDMDIAPVPLCLLCSLEVFGIAPSSLARSKSESKRHAHQRKPKDG